MTTLYSGGIDGNIRYHSRSTLRVGMEDTTVGIYTVPVTNRGVLVFNLRDTINNTIAQTTGFTAENPYSVTSARLSLVCSNGKKSGDIFAFMLPLETPVDTSISWLKPTEKKGISLDGWSLGGSVEPLTQGISVKGEWNGSQIEFDITMFVNIWLSSGKSTFAIAITSLERTKQIWEFYSQQTETPVISGSPLTNVRFLGSGDTNTMNTEGIVVRITPQFPYLAISPSDISTTALNRWAAFNASVSVGNSFSMFLPDTNIPASTYTLLDKRNTSRGETQFIVSGSTSGFETEKHATAEFSCTGTVDNTRGIVEFASPNNSLKVDLTTLGEEDTIFFDYTPTTTPNNAKSFTVDYAIDETLKNNRSRIYLKEQTVSENRTGLVTVMRKSQVKPKLSLNILI